MRNATHTYIQSRAIDNRLKRRKEEARGQSKSIHTHNEPTKWKEPTKCESGVRGNRCEKESCCDCPEREDSLQNKMIKGLSDTNSQNKFKHKMLRVVETVWASEQKNLKSELAVFHRFRSNRKRIFPPRSLIG